MRSFQIRPDEVFSETHTEPPKDVACSHDEHDRGETPSPRPCASEVAFFDEKYLIAHSRVCHEMFKSWLGGCDVQPEEHELASREGISVFYSVAMAGITYEGALFFFFFREDGGPSHTESLPKACLPSTHRPRQQKLWYYQSK